MYRKVSVLSVFLFVLIINTTAQEQLGLKFGNYVGPNMVQLNPAQSALSNLPWTANLMSAGVFMDNNYAFIENTNLRDLIRRSDYETIQKKDLLEEDPLTTKLVIDYTSHKLKKFASILTVVYGPSASIKLDANSSIGVFVNAKVAVGISDLPVPLTYGTYYERPHYESFKNSTSLAAGASWMELGINYSKAFNLLEGKLAFGANLKFNLGYDAFYVKANQDFTLTKLPGDSLAFDQTYFEGGFTQSYSETNGYQNNLNGMGVGLDVGFVYTIDGEGETPKWKIGASILDLGYLRFDHNAEQHTLNKKETFMLPPGLKDMGDLSSLTREISSHALGDQNATSNESKFSLATPTALSAQVDYNMAKNLFLGAVLVQRLPVGRISLKRDNILSIAPRYETKYLSFSVPMVLHNYQKFRYGFVGRLGWLTIGTDNLGSILSTQNFSGTDLYVGLIINSFSLERVKRRYKHKRRKRVRCYSFG